MKKILFIAGSFLLIFTSCKKESFDYDLYKPSVGEIDSVYFSTGANSLIADGKATLQFVVEAYRKTKVTNPDGSQKDTLVYVDYKNLPDGSLKVFSTNGNETGLTYSTTDPSDGSIGFYAQIGNVKSATKTVVLRDKQVLPVKLYVDVVFHVFELNPNDPNYDKLTYQKVTQNLLEAAIADVNNVFNNKLGNGPNGGSANIEFRLAVKNPSGATLGNSGYNMITYDKTWMTASYGFSPSDFSNKVNATPSYSWDPSRYLNIYVIPSGANNFLGDCTPKYQIVPSGDDPIPGIATIINNPSDLPTNQNYQTFGVGVPRTLLFPGTGRRIELSPYLGTYYGLMRTAIASPSISDYCNDTRKYIGTNQLSSLIKVGIDGEKFMANNAMDDNRFPSLRNTFTLDQINRIRAVMLQCPNRMHGHP